MDATVTTQITTVTTPVSTRTRWFPYLAQVGEFNHSQHNTQGNGCSMQIVKTRTLAVKFVVHNFSRPSVLRVIYVLLRVKYILITYFLRTNYVLFTYYYALSTYYYVLITY